MIVASISHRTIVSACHALAACVTCVRVATRPGISSTPYHLVANITTSRTSALPALISAPCRSLRRCAGAAVSAVGASTIVVNGSADRHRSSALADRRKDGDQLAVGAVPAEVDHDDAPRIEACHHALTEL